MIPELTRLLSQVTSDYGWVQYGLYPDINKDPEAGEFIVTFLMTDNTEQQYEVKIRKHGLTRHHGT